MSRPNTHTNPASDDYRLRVLDDGWNRRLLDLARISPVKTEGLSIHFDRSPDIFTIPKLTSYKYRCLGLFKQEDLAGYAIATYQERYIDGEVADVLYLGNMHVIERGLGKVFLEKLSQRFKRIVPSNTDVEYLYAYVIGKNIPAMKLVETGHLQSSVIGKIVMATIFLVTPKKVSSKYRVRPAERDDLGMIVQLLAAEHRERFLAPALDSNIFLENLHRRPNFSINNYFVALEGQQIVGVCSAWDMTSFKRNRVLNYGRKLALLRFLYNSAAMLFGSPRLPKPGEAFRDITIAEYAVRNRDPGIMEALLRFLYQHYRSKGFQSIIFGSSEDDPLLKATDTFITNKVISNVILASLESNPLQRHGGKPLIYADAIQI